MSVRPELLGTAPWIACRDLQASVQYYRSVLGFNGDWHWFWGDPPDHAGVSRGRARILFFVDSDRAARCAGMEIVLYVRDVESLYDELRHTGAEIVRELDTRPWGTVDFTVRDLNGCELIFTEAPDELGGDSSIR